MGLSIEPATLFDRIMHCREIIILAITDRTFSLDAQSLIYCQDRPGRVIGAYSTEGPYLKPLALLCVADSCKALLDKLESLGVGHGRIMTIRWGESEQE